MLTSFDFAIRNFDFVLCNEDGKIFLKYPKFQKITFHIEKYKT